MGINEYVYIGNNILNKIDISGFCEKAGCQNCKQNHEQCVKKITAGRDMLLAATVIGTAACSLGCTITYSEIPLLASACISDCIAAGTEIIVFIGTEYSMQLFNCDNDFRKCNENNKKNCCN